MGNPTSDGSQGADGLTPDERAQLFGSDGGDTSTTATERRLRTKTALQQMGIDVKGTQYTGSELLDIIDQLLNAPNPFTSEGDRRSGPAVNKYTLFEQGRAGALNDYIGQLVGLTGGAGAKPSTIQLPNDNSVFNAYAQDATGPAPSLLFRDVFNEHFPSLGAGESPFNKFVQGKSSDLEQQFLTQVYKHFSEPGTVDSLKSDYAALSRQAENQQRAGQGGTVPSYEDFIKGRVTDNYRSFLESQRPQLQQAFELASPQERGQRDQSVLAPMRRIL